MDSPKWNDDVENATAAHMVRFLESTYPGFWKRNNPVSDTSYNIINFGPKNVGKSSYLNSLLSISENMKRFNIFAPQGGLAQPGTLTIDGPWDIFVNAKGAPVIKYFTTMGIEDITENEASFKKFSGVAKDIFRGKMLANQDMGFINFGISNAGVFKKKGDRLPTFHMVHIFCKYDNKTHSEIATKLYKFFAKDIRIPTLVIVTHAKNIKTWDALDNIVDPGNLFFIDNYSEQFTQQEGRVCEELNEEKNKTLLLPLIRSVRYIEADRPWENVVLSQPWMEILWEKIQSIINAITKFGLNRTEPVPFWIMFLVFAIFVTLFYTVNFQIK